MMSDEFLKCPVNRQYGAFCLVFENLLFGHLANKYDNLNFHYGSNSEKFHNFSNFKKPYLGLFWR